MHMPVLKCSHGYDEAHSFEANDRRENPVIVHSLNLGEAFRHKAGSLSTVVFYVEHPTVSNDFPSFGVLYQVENVPSVEGICHRYDFLVCPFGTDLLFFELF